MAESTPAAATAARGSRQQGALSRRYSHFGAFDLELGGRLEEVTVAYETYGTLNRHRDNAVLVLHALTGDAHAAGGTEPGQPTPGWWDSLIGPGKRDTDRFVVSSNVLGGCQGTTAVIVASTGSGTDRGADHGGTVGWKPNWRTTWAQSVRARCRSWVGCGTECNRSPGSPRAAAATGAARRRTDRHSDHADQAILNDPDWCGGDYLRLVGIRASAWDWPAHLTYRTESEPQVWPGPARRRPRGFDGRSLRTVADMRCRVTSTTMRTSWWVGLTPALCGLTDAMNTRRRRGRRPRSRIDQARSPSSVNTTGCIRPIAAGHR
jgi:hypothetical protein